MDILKEVKHIRVKELVVFLVGQLIKVIPPVNRKDRVVIRVADLVREEDLLLDLEFKEDDLREPASKDTLVELPIKDIRQVNRKDQVGISKENQAKVKMESLVYSNQVQDIQVGPGVQIKVIIPVQVDPLPLDPVAKYPVKVQDFLV